MNFFNFLIQKSKKGGGILKIIFTSTFIYLDNTLKPWYNEPQYSEFRDIVNKIQLPFWGFTKHITFDIVNYSI